MFKIKLIILILFFFSKAFFAEGIYKQRPKTAIGINVSETAAFMIANKVLNIPVVYIPIHLDGSYSFGNYWGLGFGAVYRFENYINEDKGFLEKLWTDYHELFLMAGPRYSFFGTGNQGLYAALKAGVGGAISPIGHAITLVSQPEVGYSFLFGENVSFQLDLALGMLFNLPIHERPNLGFKLSPLGYVVHRTIPIVRVGFGIAF